VAERATSSAKAPAFPAIEWIEDAVREVDGWEQAAGVAAEVSRGSWNISNSFSVGGSGDCRNWKVVKCGPRSFQLIAN